MREQVYSVGSSSSAAASAGRSLGKLRSESSRMRFARALVCQRDLISPIRGLDDGLGDREPLADIDEYESHKMGATHIDKQQLRTYSRLLRTWRTCEQTRNQHVALSGELRWDSE